MTVFAQDFLLIKFPFGIVRTIVKKEECMKVIGIVGFKKSGKTTLTMSIARSLMDRGYRVAVVKHSSEPVDHRNTDTGQFMDEINWVALITPENSEIIHKGKHNLKEIMSYFLGDFLIVEGFKDLKYFPKIVCLKKADEKKVLDDGLALFTAGIDASLKEKKVVNYLVSEENDLEEMVSQVEKRAFILPDMNCGKCGYGNCYGLAQAIVKGSEVQQKCVYSQDIISIHINKKRVYLNSFMSQLYQNMIYGMFSPLKDISSLENAKIEIELNSKSELKKQNNS